MKSCRLSQPAGGRLEGTRSGRTSLPILEFVVAARLQR